jgi:PAS domain S-box-containing protein
LAEPSVKGETIRILHIDDELDQLRFTKFFLEDINHFFRITSVNTSSELLARLDRESYDCIVSDYSMPEMDGLELARRVSEKSDLPFILYTGKETEEVVERAFSVGVQYYVRKEANPSHYHVLAKCISMAVERQRVEKYLRECAEAFRSIVENTHDLIMLTRPDGTIAYLSPKSIDVIGYPPQDLLGKQAELIIYPEDQEKVQSLKLKSLKGGRCSNVEYRIITKSGEPKWVSHSWSPIKTEGRVKFVVSAIKDITEHKWMEEEFNESVERYMTLLEDTPKQINPDKSVKDEEGQDQEEIFDPSDHLIRYLKNNKL